MKIHALTYAIHQMPYILDSSAQPNVDIKDKALLQSMPQLTLMNLVHDLVKCCCIIALHICQKHTK